jgi:hypothetical protein
MDKLSLSRTRSDCYVENCSTLSLEQCPIQPPRIYKIRDKDYICPREGSKL